MTRALIAAAVLSVVAFAISRVIAIGRRQTLGYREEREQAWGGMPKRYVYTAPVETRKQWFRIERRLRKRA